jgi:hypothetical protein
MALFSKIQNYLHIKSAIKMWILDKKLSTIYRLYLNLLFAWWLLKGWLTD